MALETRRDAAPRPDEGIGEFLLEEHVHRPVPCPLAARRGVQVDADLHAARGAPFENLGEIVEERIDPGGVFDEILVVVDARPDAGDLEADERRAPRGQRGDVLFLGAVGKHAAAQRLTPLRGNDWRGFAAMTVIPRGARVVILRRAQDVVRRHGGGRHLRIRHRRIPNDPVLVHGRDADVLGRQRQRGQVEFDAAGGFLKAENERGAAIDGVDRGRENVHAVGDGAPAVGADGNGCTGVVRPARVGVLVAEHELDAVPVVGGLRDALCADVDRQHEAAVVAEQTGEVERRLAMDGVGRGAGRKLRDQGGPLDARAGREGPGEISQIPLRFSLL